MSYLTIEEFRVRSVMPAAFTDELEEERPGFLEALLAQQSAAVDARLRKRYRVPFAGPPYPEIVCGWVCRLATLRAYLARQINPGDELLPVLRDDATAAEAEIREAASASEGLVELAAPGSSTGAISSGAPVVLSDPSPYTWQDEQAARVRSEGW